MNRWLFFFLFLTFPALADVYDTTSGRQQVVPCAPGTVKGTCNPSPVTPTPPTSVTPVKSVAAESSHVLKSSPGDLLSITATNATTSGYLMLFDATSAPADGAVTPVYCTTTPASGTWPVPAKFSVGIVAVFSTTGCFTKTASATAMFSAQVQ